MVFGCFVLFWIFVRICLCIWLIVFLLNWGLFRVLVSSVIVLLWFLVRNWVEILMLLLKVWNLKFVVNVLCCCWNFCVFRLLVFFFNRFIIIFVVLCLLGKFNVLLLLIRIFSVINGIECFLINYMLVLFGVLNFWMMICVEVVLI